MTFTILLMLFTVVAALVLFSIESFPVEVIALGLLLFITVTGLLPADQAFAGYGSDAVVMILGLLIMTAALTRTGVVDWISQWITKRNKNSKNGWFVMILVAAAILSSFISNTASAALFVPILIGMAEKMKTSTSKLLMPLAFATILSSSVTLVATSTNIVVSGVMTQYGLRPIGMFELTPVGLVILGVGLAYIIILGPRLIPDRGNIDQGFDESTRKSYLTEVILMPGSRFANKSLQEARLGADMDLTVVSVMREDSQVLAPQANLILQECDRLLVEGPLDEIMKIKEVSGIELDVDVAHHKLTSDDIRLVEGLVMSRSHWIGRSLTDLKLRERYGLQVLAINRHGETIRSKISQVVFQIGDVLLIQGNISSIQALEHDQDFRLIEEIKTRKLNLQKAPFAILAFLGAIGLATFDLLTLPIAVLAGVIVVFVSRSITPAEAYRDMEWKIIFLVGAMLGVGAALDYTGTAAYLAGLIVSWMGHMHPGWLLTAFFLLTMLLTQPMSNQAAAAVVVPIALQTAAQLGVNPRTFAIMIAVGASCSYLTPLEPAALMVYGPGRYKFLDFVKVGSLLTVIIYLIAIVMVPLLWPL